MIQVTVSIETNEDQVRFKYNNLVRTFSDSDVAIAATLFARAMEDVERWMVARRVTLHGDPTQAV